MKLQLLCDAAGITCPKDVENTEIEAVLTDSRQAKENTLFVCIKGLRSNGHDYASEAYQNGCRCILAEDGAHCEIPTDAILLRAGNTRRAAARLYHAWYGFPTRKLKVVGVTGTNGKTSVTHMLRAILEASLHRCGLIGTVGCESVGKRLDSRGADALSNMTTPDPEILYRLLSQMVNDGVEYAVMEVSSHALALGKLDPIEFEAAIFTNLTPEHLDFHQTMEAYAEAKAELFRRSRLSVIHVGSAYGEQMCAAAGGRVVTCCVEGDADYVARDVWGNAQGVAYELSSRRATMRIRCPIAGDFSVVNSMQAAVCAIELGIGCKTVAETLATLHGVRGRMERVRLGYGADFTVLIDYAHTPDALENLLRTAKRMHNNGRVVLLFGCGGDRDRSKRPVMGALAAKYADFVIVTSDNSRGEEPETIIREILSGIPGDAAYSVIPDRECAIRYAIQTARANDLILLAGKGHEEYEIRREGKFPFYEKEIVRQAFADRRNAEKNDTEGA